MKKILIIFISLFIILLIGCNSSKNNLKFETSQEVQKVEQKVDVKEFLIDFNESFNHWALFLDNIENINIDDVQSQLNVIGFIIIGLKGYEYQIERLDSENDLLLKELKENEINRINSYGDLIVRLLISIQQENYEEMEKIGTEIVEFNSSFGNKKMIEIQKEILKRNSLNPDEVELNIVFSING